MLRNHLFALMNAFPNHEVAVIINGMLVPVDGVTRALIRRGWRWCSIRTR